MGNADAAALPSVSVIVPVHNGEVTIGACVESLLALDYPKDKLEIIVVDNRSTDGTGEILRRYPISTLSEGTVQSSYAARNRGILHSSGECLAFTDADCVVDQEWLRPLMGALSSPDVGGVAGLIEPHRVHSVIEEYQAELALRAERAFGGPVLPFAQTANAAYKRLVFDRVGLFDAGIVFGGDLDFSWRMQREGQLRLAYEPRAVVRHRHRTTYRGLFRLYEKNAIANCLLGQRYPVDYYGTYAQVRTLLYLTREMLQNLVRAARAALRPQSRRSLSLPHAVRYAGEIWGWLRWRCGAVALLASTTPEVAHLGEVHP